MLYTHTSIDTYMQRSEKEIEGERELRLYVVDDSRRDRNRPFGQGCAEKQRD